MTMLSTAARTTRAVATRQYSRTAIVRSEPKLHKATGNWNALKSKRPVDHDDLHLVFHPPYDRTTICVLIGSVVAFGWGSMYYGFVHQQYKQGYWK